MIEPLAAVTSSDSRGAAARIERGARCVSVWVGRLCAVLFALVFLIFCYKIVRRYAAGDALAWADEVCVVLFIWIVFLANGLVVPSNRQIAFDLLYRHLSPGAQRWVERLRSLLVGVLIAVCLPGTIDYIAFLWREKTPVMLWPLNWVYACFAVFAVAMVVRLAWAVYRPGTHEDGR